MITVDVWGDIACPWCFIGSRFLQRAVDAWDGPPLVVRHRAFELQPDMPDRGAPYRPWMERRFGGPEAVDAAFARVTEAAAAAGIDLRLDRVACAPNTRPAHRVVALAGRDGQAGPVLRALYHGYFCDGVDVTDPAALTDLVAAAGRDDAAELVARAWAGEGEAPVAEDQALARRLGATAVPLVVAGMRRGLVGAHPPEHLLALLGEVADGSA